LGAAAWAAVASAQEHAHRAAAGATQAQFEFFKAPEAADIAAISEQILPSGDGPGAREAGIVYFIDRALTTFDASLQDAYRKGMSELQDVRGKMFPGSTNLASLPPDRQLEVVRAIEKTDFFETVRTHTLLGFLGNPSYGGNRDKVGWKHIGFEMRMAWAPPFGYYDAEPK
jgi:gluconate 2-dehydrogenase gamma chain